MIIVWVLISFGVVLGAMLASHIQLWIEPQTATLSLLGLLISFGLLQRSRLFGQICLCFFSLLYGFCSVETAEQKFQTVSWRANGKIVIVAGEVLSFPEKVNASQRWMMSVRSFRMEDGNWMTVQSSAEVSVPAEEEPPLIGDRIILKGRVSFPENKSMGSKILLRRYFLNNVAAQIRVRGTGHFIDDGWNQLHLPLRLIQLMREGLENRLDAIYQAKHSLVLKPLLLGLRMEDRELRQAFNRTGTSHLLSVSGFHAAVIAGFIFAFAILLRLSPLRAVLFSAAGILIYMGLTGWGIAGQRAGMMAIFVWIAWVLGRPQKLGYWLNAALAFILILEPKRIWDISFQLSFLSMYGIVYVAPLIKRVLPLPGLDISLAAFASSYPVVVYYFQTFSWAGIAVNLLVVPAFALILPAGFISLIPGLGLPAAFAVKLLLEGSLFLVRVSASISWGCISLAQPSLITVYGYYFLGGLCVYLLRNQKSGLA